VFGFICLHWMQSLDVCCPTDEESQPELHITLGVDVKGHAPALAWWFRLFCFCYSAVGAWIAWRFEFVSCSCSSYPWRVELVLLMLQGCFSYLHDAHFQGRSPWAKTVDRTCATLLTLCQPLKFSFCPMDQLQVGILMSFWTCGLLFFWAASRAHASGSFRSYQAFHSLWHVALPLGGFLWIEYTRLLVLSEAGLEPGGMQNACQSKLTSIGASAAEN